MKGFLVMKNICFNLLISLIFIVFILLGLSYIDVYRNNNIEFKFYQNHPKIDEDNSDIVSTNGIITTNNNIIGVLLEISEPSAKEIEEGGMVSFKLNYIGNIADIWVSPGDIVLNGFAGTLILKQVDTTTVKVIIKNIVTNDFSTLKNIAVTGGTAMDEKGDLSNSVNSQNFIIKKSIFKVFLNFIYNEQLIIIITLFLILISLIAYTKDKLVINYKSIILHISLIIISSFTYYILNSGISGISITIVNTIMTVINNTIGIIGLFNTKK